MEYIKISVKDKIATAPQDALIVCGNSDYFVEFEFDDEWAESNIKTARFYYNFCHQDIVFEGNTCQVPVLAETQLLKVGVFTDNVRTTTDAEIKCQYSIKKYGGNIIEPSKDVYAQIMELLNKYIQGGGSSGGTGESGFSPTIKVEPIENGHRVIITDINGDHTFDLFNGEKGEQGENGLTPHIGDNGNWFIGDFDTGVSASGQSGSSIVEEQFLIATSAWEPLENSQPFFYQTRVRVEAPLGEKHKVEPVNNNPVFYANYGVSILETIGQEVVLIATAIPPTDSVITLSIDSKPVDEEVELTIPSSAWVKIENSQPFEYKAEVELNAPMGENTEIYLVNNKPVFFARYGLQLENINGNILTIYATKTPSEDSSITLSLEG